MPAAEPVTADPGRVARRLCPICLGRATEYGSGPGGRRLDVSCPTCRSLERHRFLAALLQGSAARVRAACLLDVAPSPQTSKVLKTLAPRHRVGLDFDPAADGRAVDVQASLTDLPFPARTFDLVLCFHVLEHVPDDAAAMRELARVVTAGGLAFLQVPLRVGVPTAEDPSATPAERKERFGQVDHVRLYGDDFAVRLAAASLEALPLVPDEVLGPDLARLMNVPGDQAVWLVRGPAVGPRPELAEEVALLATGARAYVRGLRAGLAKAKPEQLAKARQEAAHWERAYRTLRGRLPVRVMAKLTGR